MIGANKENFNINSFAYSVTGEIQNPGYRVLNRVYGNMCYTYCFSPLNPYRPPRAVNTADGEMVCSRRYEIPVCQEVS